MENELYHHGILGMKWGIRRYQNKDGSLTPAGRRRYGDFTPPLGERRDKLKSAGRGSKTVADNVAEYKAFIGQHRDEACKERFRVIQSDHFQKALRNSVKETMANTGIPEGEEDYVFREIFDGEVYSMLHDARWFPVSARLSEQAQTKLWKCIHSFDKTVLPLSSFPIAREWVAQKVAKKSGYPIVIDDLNETNDVLIGRENEAKLDKIISQIYSYEQYKREMGEIKPKQR